MIVDEVRLILLQRACRFLVAGFNRLRLAAGKHRQEAEHETDMVVGLAVLLLELQPMGAKCRPHLPRGIREQAVVLIEVVGFPRRGQRTRRPHKAPKPGRLQIVDDFFWPLLNRAPPQAQVIRGLANLLTRVRKGQLVSQSFYSKTLYERCVWLGHQRVTDCLQHSLNCLQQDSGLFVHRSRKAAPSLPHTGR